MAFNLQGHDLLVFEVLRKGAPEKVSTETLLNCSNLFRSFILFDFGACRCTAALGGGTLSSSPSGDKLQAKWIPEFLVSWTRKSLRWKAQVKFFTKVFSPWQIEGFPGKDLVVFPADHYGPDWNDSPLQGLEGWENRSPSAGHNARHTEGAHWEASQDRSSAKALYSFLISGVPDAR